MNKAVIISLSVLLIVIVGLSLVALKSYKHSQDLSTELIQLKADLAKQVSVNKEKAKSTEKQLEATNEQLKQSYENGFKAAQSEYVSTINDLTAGNLRLREEWRGCQNSSNLSSDTSSTPRDEELEKLRKRDSAAIVRLARQCTVERDTLAKYANSVEEALRNFQEE